LKVRAIAEARIKTDKISADILCDLLRSNLLPEAYVPDKETREAKNILRQRMFFVRVQTMVKNRIYTILDRHPEIVTQAPEVSDLFEASGMKAPDDEGKTAQHTFQNWHQVTLRYLLHRGHNLPLRDLIHGIDMIHALLPIVVSLVNSVNSNITRTPAWSRSYPLANSHYRRFGPGISSGDAPIEATTT
jgi:hypothetical protein